MQRARRYPFPAVEDPVTTLHAPHSMSLDRPVAQPAGGHEETTVIEPRRGWIGVDVAELWRYRELLYFLVWRDLKVKYKMAVLGVLWAFAVPVVSMVIYGVVGRAAGFDQFLPAGTPYYVWMLTGLLPWLFLSRNISEGGMALVNQQPLMTKIYMPRLYLPAAACGGALVDLGIYFGLLVVVGAFNAAAYGWVPSWQIVFLPLLLVVTTAAAMGLALTLSALTVLYRDLRFLIPFGVQFGLWLSAVPYPMALFKGEDGGGLKYWLFALNPLAGLVSGWRSAVTGTPWQPVHLTTAVIGSVLMLVVGLFYFRRVERRFADIA